MRKRQDKTTKPRKESALADFSGSQYFLCETLTAKNAKAQTTVGTDGNRFDSARLEKHLAQESLETSF